MPRTIHTTDDRCLKRSVSETVESNHTADTENGFTIIEVLIALTLFVIGILGLTTLQINMIKGSSKANSMTVASAIATSLSERIRQMDFTSPDLNAGEHPAIPFSQYWVGWVVSDDVPFKPVSEDYNGEPIIPSSISKTIDIVVFSGPSGFADKKGSNRIVTFSMVKTRHL